MKNLAAEISRHTSTRGAMIALDMGVTAVFLITAIPQMCAALLAIFALWRV